MAPVDLPGLASVVEAELDVECDSEVITDAAGFDKVVCTVPEGTGRTGWCGDGVAVVV